MRRIVMFEHISADGYFAAADGQLDWVVAEPEMDKEAAAGSGQTDTMIFGRKTYQMFEQFWPKALEDPTGASDPHSAGRRTPELEAIARSINEATKIVFSRTLKTVTWQNSQLRTTFNPGEIAAIKEQPGKHIMVFGSGEIATQLAAHGLIDEYQFLVSPVILGRGHNLFTNLATTLRLTTIETKAFPTGVVRHRYEPTR
jgi:dihydrofolate reductase